MKNNGLITGRLEGIKQKLSSFKIPAIFTFIFLGVASSVWFLARVIPKPSRAGYPCMKAAAPIMSGFVIYLITLSGSALFFKKAYTKFKTARYKSAIIASLVCLMLVAAYSINDSKKLFASTAATITPITWDTVLPDGKNNPMGSGIGIFPGRVVWAWSPNATVATCTQSITDAFFMPKNNNQDTINKMADNSIKQLSGQPSIKAAWDTIFKYFNYAKTGVASGYTSGQTIFIKVNNGQAGWAIKGSDLSEIGESSTMTGKSNIAIAETTPSTVFALVRQLVDSCGIPQNKIYIGEPMTHVFKSMNDLIHSVYPNVKVMDKGNYTSLGRTTSTGWTKSVIFY